MPNKDLIHLGGGTCFIPGLQFPSDDQFRTTDGKSCSLNCTVDVHFAIGGIKTVEELKTFVKEHRDEIEIVEDTIGLLD